MLTGSKLIELGSVPSTNDYAINECDRDLLEEGTIIWTRNQTSGKGQRGRVWEQLPNDCLAFSIVYYPSFLPIERINFLGIIIAIAVRKYLSILAPDVKIQIKWPNDLVVNNSKIAGILIENSLQSGGIQRSVCGIGININQDVFPQHLPHAISLRQITGECTDLKALLNNVFFKLLDHYYLMMKRFEFKLLLKEFNDHLWGKGEEKNFNLGNRQIPLEIIEYNMDGSLLVKDVSGQIQLIFWPEHRLALH